MKATVTSIAAFHSTPLEPVRDRVMALIESFGEDGCITDDVIAHFAKTAQTNTGRLTGRFSELVADGRMYRAGDTRTGVSGKQQQVMRSTKFTASVPVIPVKKKKTGFYAGLRYAAELLVKADPSFKGSAAAMALKSEIRKATL